MHDSVNDLGASNEETKKAYTWAAVTSEACLAIIDLY